MENTISLEFLQGAENVVYEARDDTTGVSFNKNGKREWLPVVVTNQGKEMSPAAELKRCKKIVYFENENTPHFSI